MPRSLCFVIALVSACSSDDKAGPDAPLPDARPPDGASECNALAVSGPVISLDNVASAAPTPQGGTASPGTYVLTSAKTYTGTGGASGPSGSSYRAATSNDGTHFQYTEELTTASGTRPTQLAGTFSTSGTTFTRTNTCPDQTAATLHFDATATEFTFYEQTGQRTTALTFTKQ